MGRAATTEEEPTRGLAPPLRGVLRGVLRGLLPALVLAVSAGILTAGCADDGERVVSGRLYVTSGFTDEVFILDAADGRVLDRRLVDRRPGETDEPHGVAVAPDGRHWYTTLAHGAPTLWKFESEGDRLVGRVELETGGASRVRLTPDGERAFIPDYRRTEDGRSGQVAVLRPHDMTLLDRVLVCPGPHDALPDPSGVHVAVTCALSDEVVVLDARSLATLGRITVGPAPGQSGQPRYRPMNAVWADGGDEVDRVGQVDRVSRLYVTLMASDEVIALDVVSSGDEADEAGDGPIRTVARVSVGGSPAQIARVGPALVTANRADESLSVLRTDPVLDEVERIALPGATHPHGLAAHPDGRIVFVSFEGTVNSAGGAIAVDVESGRELWRTELGDYVLGIAWSPSAGP